MDITKLTRLTIPMTVSGISRSKKRSKARLIESLTSIEFITQDILDDENETKIILKIISTDDFFNLIASEAANFFLASRISFERACQKQPKNAAWEIIEHYYAAYFSIHYLLRMTGTSLSNIDQEFKKIIIRSLIGKEAPNIPTGLYTLIYNNEDDVLTLKKRKKKSSGGSHKDAWDLWSKFLYKILALTENDPQEYSSVAVNLIEHRDFIYKSDDHFTPPNLRSDINYKFKGNTWEFEKKSEYSISTLKRIIDSNRLIPQNNLPNPENLIINNNIIISLANSVFRHSADNYPKSIFRSLKNQYKSHI